MDYGWSGKLVRLVPLDEARHMENAQRWINDPRVTSTLGITAMPITLTQEREFFTRGDKGNPSEITFAIETLDGRHLGFSGVHQISWVNRHALTGSLLGNPEDWGKGYGSEAAAIRAWFCFEVLNLSMLKTAPLQGNDASRRMSAKLGFAEYGVLPKAYFRLGEWKDEHLLYCTKEMWLATTGGSKPGSR